MSTSPRPIVLLVDSENAALRQLGAILQTDFAVRAVNNAERALHATTVLPHPDIVLLDTAAMADLLPQLRDRLPAARFAHLAKPLHGATLRTELLALCGMPASAGAAAPLAGRRALVAEDDDLLRQALIEQLQALGIGCATAIDGTGVLALTAIEHFDWILLDVQMPVMDGLETVRRLRADPATATLVVIAATGSGDSGSRAACQAAGMDDILVKPIEQEVLSAMLTAWLERPAGTDTDMATAAGGQDTVAVDLGKLVELGRGDAARMRKFGVQVASALGGGLDACTAALAAADLDGLAGQAHRLKSSARWVGALAVGDHFAALETAAKAANASRAAECLAACRAASADFLPQLQHFLDTLPQTSPSPRNPDTP